MTDRELLELAAKAAEVDGCWVDDRGGLEIAVTWRNFKNYETWNPLKDDGQALRLAVKLGLRVYPPDDSHNGGQSSVNSFSRFWVHELEGSDPYDATRRAIVRAAAEIGRSMK